MNALNQHITGASNLSDTRLYELMDEIKENADDVDATRSTIEDAVETIQLYESNHGALFTSEGTQSFSNTITDGDGLALERTMHELYLAVFDMFDAGFINDHPAIADGLEFGSASYFPGDVASPNNPQAVYSMEINASVPEDWGRPNLYSLLPARRPTGAYVAPGDVAEVIVPSQLVGKGYQIRVGAHSWDLSGRPSQRRVGRASVLYPVTSTVTRVANPLGGNIYIEVPYLADDGIVTVQFRNTVRAPFFSARGFDQMTNAEWQDTERNHPGAFTDIESDRVMLSVPSKWVRDFDDPAGLMEEYDAIMDVVSAFMGKPEVRNKTPMFMQVDVIFRGTAFFPGYPMSNYPSFDSDTPRAPMLRDEILNSTFLHEHGHATYMTKFRHETEAAVHNLYVAVATELYDMPLEEALGTSLGHSRSPDISLVDALNSWVLRDSFVDNLTMDNAEAGYRFAGHADYVEIIDLFGIEVLQDFNRQLNVDFVEDGFDIPDRNNHQADDRILRLSREAGVDLTPLMHMWGAIPENAAQLKSQMLAENLLPSEKIYDRMLSYRATVPVTQAQFNTFYDELEGSLWYVDFWEGLRAGGFQPARGLAAIDRIEELVDIYFPDGRPDGSDPVPEASACVATSNLALNQDATQSSEFGNNAFPAANALDGNFANFTHTAPSQAGASWEVELQSNSIIDNVVLHNRGSCCKSRLRDITVSVINSSGTTVFQSPLLNPENTANSPNQIAVDISSLSGEAVVGNTIRIDRTSDPDLSGVNSTGGISESDVLSLAEVEVFGCVN